MLENFKQNKENVFQETETIQTRCERLHGNEYRKETWRWKTIKNIGKDFSEKTSFPPNNVNTWTENFRNLLRENKKIQSYKVT